MGHSLPSLPAQKAAAQPKEKHKAQSKQNFS
jgi:hypothetical protein